MTYTKKWLNTSEADAPSAAPTPLATDAPTGKSKAKSKSKVKAKPSKEAPYAVGYCKPPKHTQFKEGKSGNPKERPKRPKALEDTLSSELIKVVTVTMDGKPTKLTQGEVAIKAWMRLAMGGNLPAIRLIMSAWGLLPPEAAAQPAMTQADLQLLQEVISSKLAAAVGGGPDQVK